MKRFRADAIVLGRTNYGEADRIITFLTPDHGKVRGIAKGVRKPKSKLAAGIELLSVCDVLFLVGRSDIYTVASTRLRTYFGQIVKDLERTEIAYRLIKLINKSTADAPERAYFNLLEAGLSALDDPSLDPDITALWFNMQLLKLSGHAPELLVDTDGQKLETAGVYGFHMDRMRFTPETSKQGSFTANHIKFLRLGFEAQRPQTLHRIKEARSLADSTQPLVQSMLSNFVSI